MNSERAVQYIHAGVSFGQAFALVLSWSANHSLGWALIHGWCGWFYVGYYWWTR